MGNMPRTYIILIVLFCFVILFLSLHRIINYFNPSGLIYLNMYSIYYICFITTVFLAITCNLYIYQDNITQITGLTIPTIDPTNVVPAAAIVSDQTPNVHSLAVITPEASTAVSNP
jgi:hypothetical protein